MARSSLVKGPARFIILLAGGVCTLALGTVLYAATLNQTPPALPHAFNGTVTIAGNPAPVDTEVCGQIGGANRGCITITTAGQYGAPGLGGDKLLVQAPDSEVGETISFRVTPPGTVGGLAAETDVYTPGDVETLNLTLAVMPAAPTPTPTVTPTFTPTATPTLTPTPAQTPTATPRPAATATPLPPLTIVPEEEVTPPPPEPTPEGSQSGPVTRVVQPDQATEIEVPGEGVTLEFSETVYQETLQVRVQPLEPRSITTAPTIVEGSDVQVSRAFHVSLYYADGRPAPGVHLWRPARISITLTDQEVEDMGGQSHVYQLFIDGRLGIFRSEDGISWSALDTSFDLSTNTFTAWVSGFSVFTLVGPQGGQPEPAETPVSTPTAASTPILVTASATPAPTAAVTPLPSATAAATPPGSPTASASPSATTLPAWTPSPTPEIEAPVEPPSDGGPGWALPVAIIALVGVVAAAGGGMLIWRRRSS